LVKRQRKKPYISQNKCIKTKISKINKRKIIVSDKKNKFKYYSNSKINMHTKSSRQNAPTQVKKWKKVLFAISLTTILVFLIDAIWIYFGAMPLYNKYFNMQINLIGAIFAYICIMIGIFASKSKTHKESTIKGALIGIAMYGVYGFTNTALFSYPLFIAITDVIWGAILCGVGAHIYHKSVEGSTKTK
jgi:uncharacterized membrane protein